MNLIADRCDRSDAVMCGWMLVIIGIGCLVTTRLVGVDPMVPFWVTPVLFGGLAAAGASLLSFVRFGSPT